MRPCDLVTQVTVLFAGDLGRIFDGSDWTRLREREIQWVAALYLTCCLLWQGTLPWQKAVANAFYSTFLAAVEMPHALASTLPHSSTSL